MIRNKKKYHFIYKTTNLINRKFYIGMHSSNSLYGYLGSGKQLRPSIRKYGKENFKFEILEFLPNRNELIEKEKELINEDLLKHPLCMNLIKGGIGGWMGNKNSISILLNPIVKRKAIKNSLKSIKEKRKSKKYVDLWNEHLSESLKNHYKEFVPWWKSKKHKQKSIAKIKKSQQGKQVGKRNSQFDTCWITNGIKSKKIDKCNKLPIGWKYGRI